MRVVGGRYRGRLLAPPADAATRPTADRVREAVFNILAHSVDGFVMEGARALDLFAGTGALGIEALSRGAAFCMFVEDDAAARGVIRANVDTLGLTGVTKIFRRNATELGAAGKHAGFTLLFADPPYDKGLAGAALSSAVAGGWLAADAIAVVEERAGAEEALPSLFQHLSTRTWGDTQVSFVRYSPPP